MNKRRRFIQKRRKRQQKRVRNMGFEWPVYAGALQIDLNTGAMRWGMLSGYRVPRFRVQVSLRESSQKQEGREA